MAETLDTDWLPRRRFALLAAGLSLAGLAALLRGFYHDDAYIALRYARSLLDGQGLVWNAGERVEGYTSFLWVLATAALGKIGVDLEIASRVLGLASLLALLGVIARRRGRPGAFACLMLATSGPIIAWSFGGLETVGFAFLLTSALLAAARLINAAASAGVANEDVSWTEALGTGVLFGLAELCRPEALLFFGVAATALAPGAVRIPQQRRALAAFVCGFAVIFVCRLIWRVSYYGDLLPNTFAVKATAGWSDLLTGGRYLARFAVWCPAWTLLAAWAAVASRGKRLERGEAATLFAIVLYLAYVATIGGDHMQWFRFVVPVLPISSLLIARRLELAAGVRVAGRLPARLLLLSLCILNAGSSVTLAIVQEWTVPDPAAAHGRLVGLYIRDHWPADALVALNTAGSTPYFSGFRAIDMLGLNDRTIARRHMPPPVADLPWARLPGHRKGDGAYVLSRHPDYIILGGSEGSLSPWFVGDKELVDNPAFTDLYAVRDVTIPARDTPGAFQFRYFELRSHGAR
jgi:hypothetical protein